MQIMKNCPLIFVVDTYVTSVIKDNARMRVRNMDALNLYLHLRKNNPAPYAAWLNFSREDICIWNSPKRFPRLDEHGVVETKPINGTIARGMMPHEDKGLKLQLQYSSEKSQAENLMIVDLLRNDLGRVCEAGTVCVPGLFEVESYASVHTLVSTRQGKKKSSKHCRRHQSHLSWRFSDMIQRLDSWNF